VQSIEEAQRILKPVLHNGSAQMMDSMIWDLAGILIARNIKPENQNAALGLAALAIIVSKGRATPAIAKAEAGIAKAEIVISKAEMNYTKSNFKLGQLMHKEYKLEEAMQGIGHKEFRLPSGKRIDFIDIDKGIIYELKPFNPRAMKAGEKQLQMYKRELQKIPEYRGIEWRTILDTY